MRLARVTHGHSRAVRAFFAFVRLTGKREPPDILKTLYYRPEFFGMGYSAVTHEIMRGPSPSRPRPVVVVITPTSSLNRSWF